MTAPAAIVPRTVKPALSRGEFIALIAMLFATIAISIDAMLPAMPQIEAAMTPDAPNRAQLIIATFVLGMGIGTLVTGPLSDAFGRKPVIMAGAAIYCAAAVACYFAGTLDFLLLARFFQGIGAAAPRTVSLAMVRDLYSGRQMASIMSYAMMVFMLVPALAPMLGQVVIWAASWHDIFLIYVVFSLVTILWLGLRQPETIHPEDRKPLSFSGLVAAGKTMLHQPIAQVAILIQALLTGVIFSTISSIQGIFEKFFDQGAAFPYWFGGIALLSGLASLLNAKLVVKVGMLRMIQSALVAELVLTLAFLAVLLVNPESWTFTFTCYLIWQVSVFAMIGLTMGNLNAIAMEPLGHIAGFASSIIASVATVLSVVIAVPVGQAFDGTPLPLVLGITVFVALALILSPWLKKRD
jgi:DHA1 family bicyclomycin/chloramphenicol resistance-like MFS transporter